MNATGKRRLLSLAKLLETKVPPKKFKMTHWTEGKKTDPRECGTAGCAIGWATTLPHFKKAGLRVVRSNEIDIGVYSSRLVFGRQENWGVPPVFFDISHKESRHLFAPDYYNGNPTPKTVAKRIRALVASEQKRAA